MPRTTDLTPRQRETLEWIKQFIGTHGMPPTVREIGTAFGIKSSSTFDMLKALERKGYLRRGELGARSLIVKNRISGHRSGCADIPIVGRIPAGQPIEAIEHDRGTVAVSQDILRGGEAYVLTVEGSSMVDAGVLDGDYVIVRKQDTADDGDIVVALIGDDATLKRVYREEDGVRLEPANRQMTGIRIRAGDFRIQGKVISIIRIIDRGQSPERG